MSPVKRKPKSKKENSGMADKDPGYSPFVKAVAGDGTSPPDVRVLTGWLGASSEDGSVRLYLDAALSAYVDIARDAVLYSEEIANSHPAGQRSVWVQNDAELKEGGSAIARAAKFLFGQVQQDFLGGAGGAQPQAPQTQICLTFKPGCQPSIANPCIPPTETPNCRFTRIPCSVIDACPSALIECNQPTSPPCMTAAPCTCPGPVTVKWPGCGSAVDACPTRICITQTESGPRCFGDLTQAQVGGPGFATAFCTPPPPSLAACPTPTILGCPTVGFCPPRTIGCPVPSAFCPTRFNCPFPSQFQCPSFGRCPSYVDACPSSLGCTFACGFDFQQTPVLQQQPQFDAQQFAQQQVGGTGFATAFCTPPPSLAACPTPTILGCPTVGFCPPQTIGCPVPSAFCPTRFNCPFPSQFQCPSLGPCPSAFDACPSSLGCTFACDWTIVGQTPVIQPQFDANVFGGGGFVGAGGKTVILPGPGTSQFCVTAGCQTPIVACPDPNPSVAKPCSTAIPALCPDLRQPFAAGGQAGAHTAPGWCGGGGGQHTGHPCITGGPCTGFAANVGWTAPNGCPYHSYPMCNSHIPCATAPPCF